MRAATSFRIVLITAGSDRNALEISRALVKQKLAACVNVLPNVRSIYRWEGKIQEDREWLLVVKTRESLLRSVERMVRKYHAYKLPEIIVLPLSAGSAPYLQWLRAATTPERK